MGPRCQLDPPPVPAAGGKELPFSKVFVMFSSSPLRTPRAERAAFAPAVEVLCLSAQAKREQSSKNSSTERAYTQRYRETLKQSALSALCAVLAPCTCSPPLVLAA